MTHGASGLPHIQERLCRGRSREPPCVPTTWDALKGLQRLITWVAAPTGPSQPPVKSTCFVVHTPEKRQLPGTVARGWERDSEFLSEA